MNIYHLVSKLEKAKVHFELLRTRDGAITIFAVVPGERWEIDVHEDGRIDFEVFSSSGYIRDEAELISKLQHLDE